MIVWTKPVVVNLHTLFADSVCVAMEGTPKARRISGEVGVTTQGFHPGR